MRLLFSEAKADYSHYIFPYVIWAIPEEGERPADLFDAGFLPSSPDLDRFYLCRQIRVDLTDFRLTSENRRVLRKGRGLNAEWLSRQSFSYTEERRRFYKEYADIKFGRDVMTWRRLDTLFESRLVSHVLLFTDAESKSEVGTATLYIEPGTMAYYYYAFYDLNYYRRNLGMYMMTYAAQFFAEVGIPRLYLGSCYSRNALYKAQFSGAEFCNGFAWSTNLRELKYLLKREESNPTQHLLESEDFRSQFYPCGLKSLSDTSGLRIPLPISRPSIGAGRGASPPTPSSRVGTQVRNRENLDS